MVMVKLLSMPMVLISDTPSFRSVNNATRPSSWSTFGPFLSQTITQSHQLSGCSTKENLPAERNFYCLGEVFFIFFVNLRLILTIFLSLFRQRRREFERRKKERERGKEKERKEKERKENPREALAGLIWSQMFLFFQKFIFLSRPVGRDADCLSTVLTYFKRAHTPFACVSRYTHTQRHLHFYMFLYSTDS